MAVFRPRLCQVVGASLNMRQGRRRRIPARHAIEPATSLVRFTTSRHLDDGPRSLEQGSRRRRDEIVVEERHLVVARVSLRPDEPRAPVDRQSLYGEQLAHARVVGHLGERACVRAASPAAAGPAVVRGFMRVVQADRAMADDEHQWREAVDDADIFEDAADNSGHFRHCKTGVRPDRRRCAFAVESKSGSR